MKVSGIIAEYNPFHNGHAYHLAQTRRSLESDYIIVVMSGNYVQRGAPTIIDKYSRAQMALKCGADLVLELPVCFSSASAEYFAFGGCAVLDKLGVVDNICFGTETLDNSPDGKAVLVEEFSKIADLLLNEPDEYKAILKEGLKSGLSNAAARAKGVEEILGKKYLDILETSNNILAVEYIKSLKKLGSSIVPVPVARKMTAHNDALIKSGYSSATAIRNAVFNKYSLSSLASTLPEDAYNILLEQYLVSFPVFRDDFSSVFGSILLNANGAGDLTKYFGVSEDLANRMIKHKNEYRSFSSFRDIVYARNITKATVSRAMLHISLGILEEDMKKLYNTDSLSAVKMLGFRKEAQPLLSQIKQSGSIRLVSKLADYTPASDSAGADTIIQTTRADMLYRMICMNKFDNYIKTPFEKEVIII